MAKKPQRRCKICRAKFTPAFENHRWCCPEHGAEYAMQELEKKREKQAHAKAKKERAEWRKRKAAVKPLRHWEDMTQRVVNDYIRDRWYKLRLCRHRGTVLVDYRILKNFVRIYQTLGETV